MPKCYSCSADLAFASVWLKSGTNKNIYFISNHVRAFFFNYGILILIQNGEIKFLQKENEAQV